MPNHLQRLQLKSNPFEPAATGVPPLHTLALPADLKTKTLNLLDAHQGGSSVRAIIIVGEYGVGKTCLLEWLHREVLPERNMESFYFDNPGVQFYDLANRLLRTIGSKNFAKFIWELAGSFVDATYQKNLFEEGFEKYAASVSRQRRQQQNITIPLQKALITAGVTSDAEIAYCLSRIVTETATKPYFEYRDFLPRTKGSIVSEGEEAPYFQAILKTMLVGQGPATAIAFLIDEFEEIGLQKRLTKRAAHDYLATLKRLVNLAQSEQIDFWIVLSMTPEAYETTKKLEPALTERFSDRILHVDPLTREDAYALMKLRLASVRSNGTKESVEPLYPFPEEMCFRPHTYSNPRHLVKSCFRAIGQSDSDTQLPFTKDYLHRIEEELYPSSAAATIKGQRND